MHLIRQFDGQQFSARARIRWIASVAGSVVARSASGERRGKSLQPYPRDLTRLDIDRWMTELSNWRRWGRDDSAGTVNLITPAKRKEAARLVKEGISVSMSLDADIPPKGAAEEDTERYAKFPHYTWQHIMRTNGVSMKHSSGYIIDTYSMSFHGNNTTHLDALCHFIYGGHAYNGVAADEITEWGAEKDDVMAFKNGFFTRGVLIDLPAFKGVSYLGDDEPIFPEDLQAWEDKTGTRVEPGDALFFRTGRWVRVREKGQLNLNTKAPGLYASCAKWLKERDISILGSDVVQDVRPSRIEGVNQPIHQLLLIAVGMPLFDNCDLEALSQQAARL